MLSRFREHFGTAGLIVAVIALIAATAGGALAATSGGGSSASKTKAVKGPRGPRGFPGKDGAPGPQGPAGATGPVGATGTAGSVGKGATVKPIGLGQEACEERGGALVTADTSVEVCNGEEGAEGVEGKPWTPNGTLPTDATETGAWGLNPSAADPEYYVPISFTIPLASGLEESKIHFGFPLDEPFHSICPGTAVKPTAPKGQLCIYLGESENVEYLETRELSLGSTGANIAGAVMNFKVTGAGYGVGAWAVTGG